MDLNKSSWKTIELDTTKLIALHGTKLSSQINLAFCQYAELQ